MEASAPEVIIRTPEQETKKLEQGVSAQLKEMGHHVDVTPGSEKPPQLTEELKQIGGDIIHSAGSAFEERMHGEESTTHARTAEGKVPISIATAKGFKRGLLNRLGLKKAA